MFLGGNTIIPQGGAEMFTLNRANLGIIAAAKDDGYFKDPAFWREVLITFQKTGSIGGQRKTLCYTSNDVDQMTFSPVAMVGEWKIREVVIIDKDHGKCVLERLDIPNVDLYDLEVISV
ncbi:MAG: hypothetical protein PHY47_00230 [Lachnospiraceae bacterium]|nr:hypothetical protein [Lachnospiraceae bacterium]